MTKQNNSEYDWQYDALIGVHQTWFAFFSGYRLAVDELFNSLLKRRSIDILAYPFLFLIRHTIELGLKANIHLLANYSEQDYGVGKSIHKLKYLQDAMMKHFEYLSKTEPKDDTIYKGFHTENEKLSVLIDYFENIDLMSMSFRYPMDRQGNKSLLYQERINLLKIKDQFNEAVNILDRTRDVLEPLFEMIDEYRETYQY
ncbi:hypothetical protein KC717_02195 [Candidatus Dojkabacteria bacterium]|uniref:Uncharacterized protein n=1 Tax=Candidatus Dojkabacteria bacterium TaxID=2099670 RepID=A0A955RKJ3_9BACT|nr:hypothetical protein [Candidatus Dojkabacteria bacterium]